jgi:hypothetical protein
MFDSRTKRRVTAAELAALTARAFGPGGRPAAARELTDGAYNAVYAVTVDGRELILKVAPPPGLKLLTHEVDLLRTEVEFYHRAGPAGVPVPEVRCQPRWRASRRSWRAPPRGVSRSRRTRHDRRDWINAVAPVGARHAGPG